MKKFGFDLGMSSVKMFGSEGGLMFMSQASLASGGRLEGSLVGMKSRRRPIVVEGEFGKFYVGKGAHDFGQPVESMDFEKLTGTPEMRAILYGSLTAWMKKHGRFTEPLSLMLGLPFQMMMGDDAKRNQVAVREWIGGHHEWYADGELFQVDVEKTPQAPQALGAPFDYAFNVDGTAVMGREDALKRECGTVAIGSNTVELLVSKNNTDTERFNGGKAVGVRRLFQRVDPKGLYTYGELDEMLRSGELDVKPHIASWAVDVNDFINKKWEGAYERFYKVFIVGGGAILLNGQLTARFKEKAMVNDDPVMAIARGLYKLNMVTGK